MMNPTYRSWTILTLGSLCLAFVLSKIIMLWLPRYGPVAEAPLNVKPTIDSRTKVGKNFLEPAEWLTFASDTELNEDEMSVIQSSHTLCTMETCFDFSRCKGDFKVYVYPSNHDPISPTYRKILGALHRSNLLTNNPEQACIFIPSLDTLDRDPLSPQFGHRVASQLVSLPFWNQLPEPRTEEQLLVDLDSAHNSKKPQPGRNHLLFNLYAGTWPNYHEDEYRLLLGQAILAKASFSTTRIRRNFDISLPLIHPQHAETMRESVATGNAYSSAHLRARVRRPILLSFKGKRYVMGIGSASRNALFHLHNGDDIIMLTTCRHGSDWVRYADRRCAIDMALYDKYDYNELMHNSTFCLVSRGRRLGSYRFLEALQASCIPVMLSNDWELPFSEVIDWRRAVVWGDERLLLTLPLTLRRLSDYQIVQLRQQVAFLWTTYFRSVESIVLTTLEIIRDRVSLHRRSYAIWNSPPGGLILSQQHATHACQVPLEQKPGYCASELTNGFTMIIPLKQKVCNNYEERMRQFAASVFQSKLIRKIFLIWLCPGLPPSAESFRRYFHVLPEVMVQDELREQLGGKSHTPSPAVRFQPFFNVPTLAVFAFTMELNVTKDEVEFGFHVWQEFPNRLVGYQPASHQRNATTGLWEYVLDPKNQTYSIVLFDAAFYHRYYNYLYWLAMEPKLHEIVGVLNDCEDLLMNTLIGHISQAPPLLLHSASRTNRVDTSIRPRSNLMQRSACLQAFAEQFSTSSSVFWSPRGSEDMLRASWEQTTSSNSNTYIPLYYASYGFRPVKSASRN